jgi:hypothetical protein
MGAIKHYVYATRSCPADHRITLQEISPALLGEYVRVSVHGKEAFFVRARSYPRFLTRWGKHEQQLLSAARLVNHVIEGRSIQEETHDTMNCECPRPVRVKSSSRKALIGMQSPKRGVMTEKLTFPLLGFLVGLFLEGTTPV